MINPNQELSEKNFINEGYKKNPFPFWVWFFLLTSFVALVWGMGNWYSDKITLLFKESPFLQVTNREMSLFLWENPEYMRVNVKEKSAYLPAFNTTDKLTIDLAYADQFVAAPPELLFRYHIWKRLISAEFSQRPIINKDFQEFLNQALEWQPQFWPDAPKGYIELLAKLPQNKTEDLASLPLETLPIPVRMAYTGWCNYFKDKEAINQLKVTKGQVSDFLIKNPHYARNYWRNILKKNIPNYLKSLENPKISSDEWIGGDELSSFLRVGIFNYTQANSRMGF